MAYVRDIPRSLRKSYDVYANAVTVIQEQHRIIHDGFMYHASSRVVALGNGAEYDILIKVPAGSYPHFQKFVYTLSDSPADIEIFEGTTVSADGTSITVFNQNRNSSKTPVVAAFHTPTITLDGTLIHDRFVPDAGGTGINDVGIITSSTQEEWILKPSTNYLVRLTNNSGGAITASYETQWYELDYED